MPSFTTLTAALALTATVVASPVANRKAFTVQQVPHKTIVKNGPAALVKTVRKFGKTPSEALMKAAAVTGTVAANPSDSNDSSYLCPVTIGDSNPTTLNLDFDTGSADLWAFSSLQDSSELSGHNYYQTDSSKELSGESWSIQYGDQSGASGTVYADKVVVGGVTATSQAVEAATSVSAEFSDNQNTDGLLGLAFSTINTVSPDKQSTFFDNVKSSLSSPLFSVDLKYHAAGSYDFGFIDSSKYTGAITYTNVDNSQGFWGLTFDGYSIGSGSTKSTSISGIADTGTTLLLLPTSVVEAYYAQISGSKNSASDNGYIFPCSATPPDFTFDLNGVSLRIPGKYINYSSASSSGNCFGGIQVNTDIGFSIFGDIFLKSKYVIFDASVPQIGFADQPNL